MNSLKKDIQYSNPYSIQVELVKGCTSYCKQCGVTSIRSKANERFDCMSTDLAENIAKQLGQWFDHKRLEFALRGEPTVNPNCEEIISIFRQYFPKVQLLLSTNGDIIRKNFNLIDNYFNAGLNMLMVDVYDHRYQWWRDNLSKLSYKFYDFYENKPKVYTYKGYKQKQIILMDNITKRNMESLLRKLNNQGGNVTCPDLNIYPLSLPLVSRCSNPFHELVIFYDGSIPICCMDYRERFILGKTPDQSLKDIWNSDLFNAARVYLYNKNRFFSPCEKCNYKGYKVGLLKCPDMSLIEAKEILSQRTKLIKDLDDY